MRAHPGSVPSEKPRPASSSRVGPARERLLRSAGIATVVSPVTNGPSPHSSLGPVVPGRLLVDPGPTSLRSEPRRDLDACAARLRVSREAIDVYSSSDLIDLHVESYIWTRIAGYDLSRRHGRGLFRGRFYSQVDIPRLIEAGLTGAVFSIATWPFRSRRARTQAFLRNLATLRGIFDRHTERFRVVKDFAGYLRARVAGKIGIWIGVQGGNALDASAGDLGRIPDDVVSRITLVHLTRSALGGTSAPGGGGRLTGVGRDYIAEMNQRRILVDLAHISRPGFRDALEVHNRSQPIIVSHSGVCGVTPHWRNLEDAQVKAIANTGGVIGVIFHSAFLGDRLWGGRAASIVDHMERIITVAGEDFVALGSDWDGMICTPRDMPTVLELPVLVQRMLSRGWNAERIRKILGGNFLRVMKAIRPGADGSSLA